MPTITASPGLVYTATNAVTVALPPNGSDGTADVTSSLFAITTDQSSGSGNYSSLYTSHNIYFKNSLGQTLASSTMANFTRTMAANGYVVYSNFQPVTPVLNGTIAYIDIQNRNVTHYVGLANVTATSPYEMTFTVGAIGSGADIEIDNRDLTTTQPWRMDGSIRFRVPNTFTYSL